MFKRFLLVLLLLWGGHLNAEIVEVIRPTASILANPFSDSSQKYWAFQGDCFHVIEEKGQFIKLNVRKYEDTGWVDKDWVTVHVGLKSEGVISLDEFRNNEGTIDIEVGDEIEVALEAVEDGYGETRISREKARKISTWKML